MLIKALAIVVLWLLQATCDSFSHRDNVKLKSFISLNLSMSVGCSPGGLRVRLFSPFNSHRTENLLQIQWCILEMDSFHTHWKIVCNDRKREMLALLYDNDDNGRDVFLIVLRKFTRCTTPLHFPNSPPMVVVMPVAVCCNILVIV